MISEFEKQMSSIFGEDQIEIVKLQLFGHQPFMPRLSDVKFEYLIQKTHGALLNKETRVPLRHPNGFLRKPLTSVDPL